jgi:murein DD-endopeptidase MepM/ murein hydrolase activator NlpD
MPSGADVKQLLLQVDASVELARRNLATLANQVAKDSDRMDGSLKKVDGAFGRMGKAGEVLGGSLRQHLDDAASRIPLVGGHMTGMAGAAAGATAAVGLLFAAVVMGVKNADELQQAVRALDATLGAAGNKTGYTRDQLVSMSEAMENNLAIQQEELLGAMAILAQYDGVAGTTFKRALDAAADMAATFGGDLKSNTEAVGGALQNLAQGNVEGLTRGFKFLGTATLDTIKHLAETGKTAQAQEALLSALEGRIGKAAEGNASGLGAAFFRFGDAIADATRNMAEQIGLLPTLIQGLNNLAGALGGGPEKTASQLAGEVSYRVAGAQAKLDHMRKNGSRWEIDYAERLLKQEEAKLGPALDAARREAAEYDAAQRKAREATAAESKRQAAEKAKSQAAADRKAGIVGFQMPVDGRVTSGFGVRAAPKKGASTFHGAIDMYAALGTPVRAPAVAVVQAVGYDAKLGKYVVLDHGAGTTTKFGHLSSYSVKPGDVVRAGDVFAKTGSTGLSTGPHLHYAVLQGGKPVDPRKGKFKTEVGDAYAAFENAPKPKPIDDGYGKSFDRRAAEITAASGFGEFDFFKAASEAAIQYLPDYMDSLRDTASLVEGLDEVTAAYNNEVGITAKALKDVSGVQVDLGKIIAEQDLERMREFAATVEQDLAQGLAQALVYGDDLGDVLVNSIKRAAAALIESGLLNLLSGGQQGQSFSGMFSSFSSMLGLGGAPGGGAGVPGVPGIPKDAGNWKFFANGGVPPVGVPSIVGERGPELFIPKVPGTIIPNHAFRRGGGGAPDEIIVRVEGSEMLNVHVERVAGRTVAAAAPGIMAGAQRGIVRRLKRPGLN